MEFNLTSRKRQVSVSSSQTLCTCHSIQAFERDRSICAIFNKWSIYRASETRELAENFQIGLLLQIRANRKLLLR